MAEDTIAIAIHSVWSGNSDGDGTLDSEGRTTEYGRPHLLGGTPGRTDPEELLVGALASCYSITLAMIAERKRLPITRIEVDAVGLLARQPDKSLKVASIELKPVLTIDTDEAVVREKALQTAVSADKYCLISNAIKGNVEVIITPSIV